MFIFQFVLAARSMSGNDYRCPFFPSPVFLHFSPEFSALLHQFLLSAMSIALRECEYPFVDENIHSHFANPNAQKDNIMVNRIEKCFAVFFNLSNCHFQCISESSTHVNIRLRIKSSSMNNHFYRPIYLFWSTYNLILASTIFLF